MPPPRGFLRFLSSWDPPMGFCLNFSEAFLTLFFVFRLSLGPCGGWLNLIHFLCLLVPSKEHGVQKVFHKYLLNE